MQNYQALLARLAEIGHINTSAAVLGWDQQCYMPTGGAQERSEQLAVLGKIAHELHVAEETGRLLQAAEGEAAGMPDGSDEKLTLRVVRRDYDKATKLPTELVTEIAKATTLGHETWVKAREASNWAQFAPTVEHLLDLSRQVAEAYGYEDRPYDALLDQYEPGMKTVEVERVFGDLRTGLVALVKDLAAAPPVDDSVLRRDFAPEQQKAFGEFIVAKMGYDFERGRQDKAVHPFCTSFGRSDVRITTRFDRNWLPCALMGTVHETGHALYEQGFDPGDDNTPLSDAASLGFHESQSRLWENIVGRSRGFWDVYYGDLQRHFPGVLDEVSVDAFYKAINKVEPSLIRVEADEVTYCLHIMLRFEMEKGLIDGSIAVKDVPDAWNAKMSEYLGITPPNDAEGCLQDIHWSGASFGYFPTYALGTILSAQLFDKATSDHPAITTDLAEGEFASLLSWLRENVHKPGARYLPAELVQRACGEPAQSHSYLHYLNTKFRAVYSI
ncbi:MAG: carboxypeptidase M32 [Cytophagales bacterium]|nr:carboxypeptidase M32 [Armatimonadota bacterium]